MRPVLFALALLLPVLIFAGFAIDLFSKAEPVEMPAHGVAAMSLAIAGIVVLGAVGGFVFFYFARKETAARKAEEESGLGPN